MVERVIGWMQQGWILIIFLVGQLVFGFTWVAKQDARLAVVEALALQNSKLHDDEWRKITEMDNQGTRALTVVLNRQGDVLKKLDQIDGRLNIHTDRITQINDRLTSIDQWINVHK
jgi:hypothetical protein